MKQKYEFHLCSEVENIQKQKTSLHTERKIKNKNQR